jgi:hypothetical protein
MAVQVSVPELAILTQRRAVSNIRVNKKSFLKQRKQFGGRKSADLNLVLSTFSWVYV